MILLRRKQFTGLNDGFGGIKGRIYKTKFQKPLKGHTDHQGPWKVELAENAEEELLDIDYFSEKDLDRIEKILKEIETKPYQGSFEQHPLWEFYDRFNEFVVWSAKINEEDRLNYVIFKQQNYILVINLMGHHVIDMSYANRPKI